MYYSIKLLSDVNINIRLELYIFINVRQNNNFDHDGLKGNLNFSRPPAGFDKGNLEWLEKIFKQTVGNEREIRREEFKKIVTSKNVGRKHKYSSFQMQKFAPLSIYYQNIYFSCFIESIYRL